jgi:hypothetical protein
VWAAGVAIRRRETTERTRLTYPQRSEKIQHTMIRRGGRGGWLSRNLHPPRRDGRSITHAAPPQQNPRQASKRTRIRGNARTAPTIATAHAAIRSLRPRPAENTALKRPITYRYSHQRKKGRRPKRDCAELATSTSLTATTSNKRVSFFSLVDSVISLYLLK